MPLYCESDASFPNHQPDPVKTANLADLRREVLEQKCDLGVAYDGDADRIGVVDEKGAGCLGRPADGSVLEGNPAWPSRHPGYC